MKKFSNFCIVLMLALNIIIFAIYIFAPTNGFGMAGTIKWTKETETFVEETFGHIEDEHEKTEAFRRWIIDNIEYTPYLLPMVQTIDVDEIIETKEGICFEQATLFTIFCRISGIECFNVDGRVKTDFFAAHTWNRYKIGDTWYEIDITHDQTAEAKGTVLFGTRIITERDAPDPYYNIYRIY